MPNFLGALPTFIGDADYLGARRAPSRGHGSAMTHAASARANRAAGFVRPDIAGTPARDAALLPAGFPPFSFNAATGVNIITQQTNPQTPFRGQRVTATVLRNGTSALATAPLMQQFLVGQKPIIVTGFSVPLETFNQGSFDTNLLLPPTVPGVSYIMNVNLANPLTGTDTLLALVSIIGSAVL